MTTQLTFRLAAGACTTMLGILGWFCSFLSPVSLPKISSKTLIYNSSPLCDPCIRAVQQKPLHFYRANCPRDREHRCWLRTDSPLACHIAAYLSMRQAALSIELGEVHTAALYPGFHGCNFDLGLSDEGCVSFAIPKLETNS